MSEHIAVIEQAGVLEIHIDRPDKKNALTAAMYRAMTAALADASARADIGAVLFAGRGDAFCAGNDLKDFLAGPEGGAAAFAFIRAIAAFDKPLVAAVQGLAVGVGTTMLFHCDLIYAAPDARFVMPFVNLGIVPEAGSSLLAPALMGHAKAAAMLMLGEPMDAEGADRFGLVTAIVPADQLLDHTRAKAAALMAKPPQALAVTRRLMKGDPATLTARIDEEARLFRESLTSPEAQEAFTAFFEKRAPVFRRG
ncbi:MULTISPECIES: enoyl-CoA hydratase-related protein [unclassified Sphingobium]|uniref:enoyl-CoA hydratase-related protein n=1 Tax=unclassified Sphingobium TaxID=2611147 RepID=UPI000D17070C|nr:MULTISPECIES: enoyl-CoA hydratase-related protein [unclassified Sphingobium]MBG6119600.1 enoyl-CoA hydratase/carnithine racemase [Sphingobium sp. JAI105]PSO13443.1 enoyl-CoA hydratase [Sphingobium sp. AEW4]TWD11547.1 enoyl-CoA hydratase/carnithine racemase [Sphingobium sp. AEW010]TWD28562.1 enoyl-CoA hydratase/carnithine racemase [Sphingobium sp. AEW013]TWD30089.1 enoyl-CoA hydratase/carnithine racemase [Sphingobium sp. AEW001]